MENDNSNGRRNFLKTAGTVIVAASVPTTVFAKSNNIKQMIIFGGISEPNPLLPGVYGQVGFHFQMVADIDGRGGVGSISDPVVSEINSHILFNYGHRETFDTYRFRGTCARSNSSELMGKPVIVRVQILEADNCNVFLSIQDTPVSSLPLSAVQKVRFKT